MESLRHLHASGYAVNMKVAYDGVSHFAKGEMNKYIEYCFLPYLLNVRKASGNLRLAAIQML